MWDLVGGGILIIIIIMVGGGILMKRNTTYVLKLADEDDEFELLMAYSLALYQCVDNSKEFLELIQVLTHHARYLTN